MTWRDLRQLAVDSFACPYCGVEAGRRCVTKSGAPYQWTHQRREWPVRSAWGVGFEEGENDMLDAAIDSPDYFARRVANRREDRARGAS